MFTSIRFCLWLIVVAGSLACGSTVFADEKLNVLLVVADDLNTHLGCYGYNVKTPVIDRLAQRGMRFDRAYCQAPLCNPSRVSFLSGLRPDRTGVYTLKTPTRKYLGDWVMLPEYFRKQGYFTAQVGKIYHTEDGFEDPRSWDVEQREFGKRPPDDQIVKWGESDGPGDHTNDWEWLKTPDAETPDGIVARNAVKIMEEKSKAGHPFFLGVGFRRPHAPYAAPQKYFEMYPLDQVSLPAAVPADHSASLLPAALPYAPAPKPLTEKEQRELIAAYYACTSFVDAQVGVLADALTRLGLWENTVVIFCGDHGYHLGDHGGLWHKNSLFEISARVPLIIYAPGMKAPGQPCEQLVELVDLYPTLTAMCGLATPKNLDGVNLAPLLNDPSQPVKQAAFSLIARNDDPNLPHLETYDYLGRSVRTDRYRFTEWDDGTRGAELYDYQEDPQEFVNLAQDPRHAPIVAELRAMLQTEQQQKLRKE